MISFTLNAKRISQFDIHYNTLKENIIKNYYQILNIKQDASLEEIKKSFRKLAYIYHPDRSTNGGYSKKELSEIYEAYSVLSNREKRRDYDLNLSSTSSTEANECFNDEKELVNAISNIQYFLTYPNISPKSLQHYNSQLQEWTLNNQLNLLINQEVKLIDQAYVNLLLNILKLVNYDTFTIIEQFLQNKLDANSAKKLQKLKKTHLINHLFDKYFTLIIIILTIIICIGLFLIVKK